MSNDTNQSGSFTHAFLPGLILGLVIGAVAGAFLPDLLGGSRIPVTNADGTAHGAPREAAPDEDQPEEIVEEMIDEAGAAIEEGAEQLEDAVRDALPKDDAPAQPGG